MDKKCREIAALRAATKKTVGNMVYLHNSHIDYRITSVNGRDIDGVTTRIFGDNSAEGAYYLNDYRVQPHGRKAAYHRALLRTKWAYLRNALYINSDNSRRIEKLLVSYYDTGTGKWLQKTFALNALITTEDVVIEHSFDCLVDPETGKRISFAYRGEHGDKRGVKRTFVHKETVPAGTLIACDGFYVESATGDEDKTWQHVLMSEGQYKMAALNDWDANL